MKLSDSIILEFQELCKKELGLKLSWEESQDRAISLVRLMQYAYTPMSIEEFEAVNITSKNYKYESKKNRI